MQIAGKKTQEQVSEFTNVVCLTASRTHHVPIMMHATHPECIHHIRLLQELGEGGQYRITDKI